MRALNRAKLLWAYLRRRERVGGLPVEFIVETTAKCNLYCPMCPRETHKQPKEDMTAGIFERAFSVVSREEIFAETGLQFMEFNTLYQLLAMKLANSPLLDMAQSFLMMPDLFHWLLTGEKGNEYTDSSTTQFYNPKTKTWANDLLKKFGIPTHIFGPLLQPEVVDISQSGQNHCAHTGVLYR